MAKNSNKVQKNSKKETNFRRLAENRYAKFQYAISETIEAGIELLGTEVKSIRNGKANLRDGYCSFRDGEILLLNVHISPHKNVGSFFNHDPLRNRKLLLHKKEILKLKAFEQIYTLAMISPFSVSEKQKVLEIPDLNEAASTLNEITKFGFYEDLNDKDTLQ